MRQRSRLFTAMGVALGLALTTTLVLRTTQAVFSGTTSTPTNTWTTGGINLSNDHEATAAFSSDTNGELTGGQVIERCIAVTYEGTSPSVAVRLHSTATGDLADHLALVVNEGAGTSGIDGDCTGFGSTAEIYDGTVAGLASSTAGTYEDGVGTWTATVNKTRIYRFTITVDDALEAQGSTASSIFTWEAQS